MALPQRSKAAPAAALSAALCAVLAACVDRGDPAESRADVRPAEVEAPAPAILEWATADPARADSSDLEPLLRSFRGVRVALIGEIHFDGASLAQKARLTRALHDRLGFRVLAGETALFHVWQLRRRWAELRDAGDLRASAAAFPLWRRAEVLAPFYAHVLETRGTPAAYEVFGLDSKIGYVDGRADGGPAATDEALGPYLRRIYAALPDPDGAIAAAVTEIERTVTRLEDDGSAADAETRDRDARALDVAERALGAGRDRAIAAHGAREAAFAELLLRSLRAHYAWSALLGSSTDGNFFTNPRDAFMAAALDWYLDVVDPEAKVVVWTGGFHGIAAPGGLESDDGAGGTQRVLAGAVTLAELVKRRYGDAARIVGCTTWRGETGAAAPRAEVVPPPREESIEADLDAAGARVGSADLRALPPDHPWREPRRCSTYGLLSARAVWPRHLDVLLYARATFTTGLRRGEEPRIDRVVATADDEPTPDAAEAAALAHDAAVPLLDRALAQAAAGVSGPRRELDGRAPRFAIAAPRIAVVEPLLSLLETSGPAAVELRRGLPSAGALQCVGPTALAIVGDCDGDLYAAGPLAAVVGGAFGGDARARGPSVWRFDGPFSGRLVLDAAARIDLTRGVDRNSDAVVVARAPGVVVRIAGRTPQRELDRFVGAMRVELASSDLPSGTTRVGSLEVAVPRHE